MNKKMEETHYISNIYEYAAQNGVPIEEEENNIIERLRHENERLREMCRLLTESNNDLFEINRKQFDVLKREIGADDLKWNLKGENNNEKILR